MRDVISVCDLFEPDSSTGYELNMKKFLKSVGCVLGTGKLAKAGHSLRTGEVSVSLQTCGPLCIRSDGKYRFVRNVLLFQQQIIAPVYELHFI